MASQLTDDGPKRIRFRYPAQCFMCGHHIAPGDSGYWDRVDHRAACAACMGEPVQTVELGRPGGSALRRAHELQASAIRAADKKWGSEAAAVAAKVVAHDPDVRAWNKGGDGESRLGAFLQRETGDVAQLLHDRLIPGAKKANIDHIVISQCGVWVIDAKTYKGQVRRVDAGTMFHPDTRLYIGRRNQTKLVDGMPRQVTAVRAALEAVPDLPVIPIHPVLCFVDTDWPLLLRPFEVRGVTVMNPKALRIRIRKAGRFSQDEIARIAYVIATALPSATG